MYENGNIEKESIIYKKDQAQNMNFSAVHAFSDIMKTNIGPFGALKLLEPESGELSLTKDGGTLLKKLTITHPTAMLLLRAGLSQEKQFHDGTSSIIAFIDSILVQSEYKIQDGIHPRNIVYGLESARDEVFKILDEVSININNSRQVLRDIVSSASKTKIPKDISDPIVDAIICIKEEEELIDLDRTEILKMKHKKHHLQLVKGIVIDQGFRNEQMSKNLKNVKILVINVSLELEHSSVSTYAPVANADQQEKFKIAERRFVDDKVRSIISLKDIVGGDFLLINSKGIDGPALDILSRSGISALRRVNKKTINRLIHACGCKVVNCVDDLSPNILGFAGSVREESFKEQKYVFIDEVQNPKAITLVIGGTNDLNLTLTEEAVLDGLRALKHAFDDKKILPGGGAIEIIINQKLNEFKKNCDPKFRIGIECFSEAILEIPRCLIRNSGYDHSVLISEMQNLYSEGEISGIDIESGCIVNTYDFGIYDNYCVKKSIFQAAPIIVSQLLLVDQIIESNRIKKSNENKNN